jgi:alanine dehydrogenase
VEHLSAGLIRSSRKENERRLPIHPQHLSGIDPGLRERLYLEHGYGEPFGVSDEELAQLVGGVQSRAELLAEHEIVVLPKPSAQDLAEMQTGQVLSS